KLEYGKLELEKVGFEPAEIIRNIHSGLTPQAEEKGLVFELNMEERLADFSVVGDPTRLLQILFNLIGNAIKFTQTGYIRLSVSLEHQTSDTIELHFKVEDSGIGIEEEHLGVIFEP